MKRLAILGVVALIVVLCGCLSLKAGTAPISVTNADMKGWFFFEETPSGLGHGTGSFVSGSASPRLSHGSARLTVDSIGRMFLGTQAYAGTRLDQISRLQYSTYQTSGSETRAISLQFDVDFNLLDNDSSYQGRLVFDPHLAERIVATGDWQNWDALAGKWYATNSPYNLLCSADNPCSWAQVRANWPNAGVHPRIDGVFAGSLLLNAGGPWAEGFDGYVDELTIGINGVDAIYSFRQRNAPVARCKNISVVADADGSAAASIDDGSYNPDNTPVTLIQSPSGPYRVGVTEVTLTVISNADNHEGPSSSCSCTVRVTASAPTGDRLPISRPQNRTIAPATTDVSGPTTGSGSGPRPNAAVGATAGKPGEITKPPSSVAARDRVDNPTSDRTFVTGAESIATFAADCLTPKTDFNLGDTLCAKVTGSPLGQRQLNWVNPAGVIVQTAVINTDPQSGTFTLPATATSTAAGITVDNRRTWNITSSSTSDASLRAGVSFPCHDPTQATVDLVIYKAFSFSESNFNALSNVTSRIFVANFGPDAAQNVQVTDTVPANATFVSVMQESGPAFTCSNSAGTTTCTLPSLANGAQAIFKLIYQLTSNTQDTFSPASISTTTFETDSSDNSSTTTNTGTGGGGTPCTITCPANITQNNDTGLAGAVVSYPAPTTSGDCGMVTSDPPSGSSFPIGTTTVTVSGTGSTCTFTVTIIDTRPITISLNGTDPMTVECHSSFTDPGATATNASGGSVPVTTSGAVNVNTPGTYTLTYTATDGTNTATITRTVNVVDTTPPVITLNGTDPMTVECHTTFTDPGATATDTCAGTVPVTTSGSVDVNTPGTYTITYTAGDGEKTATVTRTVNVVDTTPPVITCPANVVVLLPPNSTATSMVVNYPAVTAVDSCSSATISSSPATGSVFPIGPSTVSGTATDAAGNSSSCQFTVTVRYNFTGFFPPISNPPTLNSVNAGRAVPVKFSLSGNKGLDIFASGFPTSGVIVCNSTDPAVDVTVTVTAGNSSLSYDPVSDQYNYVWKTEDAWAGTCRQLVIQLNDGSVYRANFRFK